MRRFGVATVVLGAGLTWCAFTSGKPPAATETAPKAAGQMNTDDLVRLVSQIALELPDAWFVQNVVRPDANEFSVVISRWPDDGNDYKVGRFKHIRLWLASETRRAEIEAGIPAGQKTESLGAWRNATVLWSDASGGAWPKAKEYLQSVLHRSGGVSPTSLAASEPNSRRIVVIGNVMLREIHRDIEGDFHGFYLNGTLKDLTSGQKYALEFRPWLAPFLSSSDPNEPFRADAAAGALGTVRILGEDYLMVFDRTNSPNEVVGHDCVAAMVRLSDFRLKTRLPSMSKP